jgi:hypothetical protein
MPTNGNFCADCLKNFGLKNKVLIKVEPSSTLCQICCTNGSYNGHDGQIFRIRGRTLCVGCLENIVEERVREDEEESDSTESDA